MSKICIPQYHLVMFVYFKNHSFSFMHCKYCSLLFNLIPSHSFIKNTIHDHSCLYLMIISKICHSLLFTTTPFWQYRSFFTRPGFFDGTGWDWTVMRFLKNRQKINLAYAYLEFTNFLQSSYHSILPYIIMLFTAVIYEWCCLSLAGLSSLA